MKGADDWTLGDITNALTVWAASEAETALIKASRNPSFWSRPGRAGPG